MLVKAHSKFSFQLCVCAQLAQLVLASQSSNNLVHALSLLIPTALPPPRSLPRCPPHLPRSHSSSAVILKID